MDKIVELSKTIANCRDSGKEPAMIYAGSVYFEEFLAEVGKRLPIQKDANVFFFGGIHIQKNENLKPLQVSILTTEDIKVMDFENFKKHLHLL